jgi:nitronate monooxygenase
MKSELPPLSLGDLKIRVPIIQGGMGVRVSTSSLASAVSNEGALGVIASVGLGMDGSTDANERDYRGHSRDCFIRSIRQTRERTKNPFGVNIMCALTNYGDLVEAAQAERVDVIISGAGLPLSLPSLVKNTRTKLVPIVSSGRAAALICAAWQRRYNRLPDALIVEGPLAGGHLGYTREQLDDKENVTLEGVLVDVLRVAEEFGGPASMPVIAAGGIFDGADIARVMKLGASGVQMATRFVCTDECDVSEKYKEAYLNAGKDDIVVIQSPVGMPGRVISNDFVKKISSGERLAIGCVYQCLSSCRPDKVNYCIAKALANASQGNMDEGFAMCGSNAYRIKKIVPVKELIEELIEEALRCLPAKALPSGRHY